MDRLVADAGSMRGERGKQCLFEPEMIESARWMRVRGKKRDAEGEVNPDRKGGRLSH